MKEASEGRGEKTFIEEGGAMRAMCHSILQGGPEMQLILWFATIILDFSAH